MRWVVKNPRQAIKIRLPLDDPPLHIGLIFFIGAFINIGLFVLILHLIPNLFGVICSFAVVFGYGYLVCLVDTKLRTDWFDQHYEIREKQREAES